jgi:radical SAM superfamily enzyme YgiQ (UPF0313 family)
MRFVLTTLNSQYVHTSLSIRTLQQAYVSHGLSLEADLVVKEYTINEDWHQIADEIFSVSPEIVLFSCYIWNMKEITRIATRLKQWYPDLIILLGGPEVGYCAEECLQQYSWVDGVFCGEGEESFPLVMKNYIENGSLQPADGFVIKGENGDCLGSSRPTYLADFNQLIFPYLERELEDLKGQILYYESSRGCPYSCQYCLSSLHQPVRFLPLERVFRELECFIQAGVRQVKFVDRTFNSDRNRARRIWQYLIDQNCNTNFHFELAADLLEQEDLELLKSVTKGRFQFEIGIQSTNPQTLALVQRVTDFEKIKEMVTQVRDLKTIHLHLDLIAGLPGEGYSSFAKSFDDVHALGADMLQLGFLKVLPGTAMAEKADLYGLIFDAEPPYEVLATTNLSSKDMLTLHHIEVLFERYGNSGKFAYTMDGLVNLYTSAFACYETMARLFLQQGWLYHPVREGIHWQRLWQFIQGSTEVLVIRQRLLQLLRIDFYKKFADEDFPIEDLEIKPSVIEKNQILKALREWVGPQPKNKWKVRGVWLEGKKQQLLTPISKDLKMCAFQKKLYVFLYDLENRKECMNWFEIEEISDKKTL